MTEPAYGSFAQWYSDGHLAHYVRTMKSAGDIIHLLEAAQPAGDMSDPAVPDLVLYQDLHGGSRVSGDMGGGRFNVRSEKGSFFLSAPHFANTVVVDKEHELRSVSFPLAQWQSVMDEAAGGQSSLDYQKLCMGAFASPTIRSAVRNLWALCDEEGAPSRLLAQAAGCEILAELCRLGGAPFSATKGGLAPWAERRCLELLRTHLSEDISLKELAAEVQLSPFHFSRMFKHSLGVPPRVYLTWLRMERVCELLAQTDLPVTEIAQEVGYSSNQVLARVFMKHRGVSPSEYRRVVRGPGRPLITLGVRAPLEGRQ
ncbi:helix-turn-helix transcriptional regulator (plasmid) [Rhizobium sp. WL3]|uniref:helix-turn-helix domain-containing protein n=1 Tax=Rhizobium sp. WL3 TaxID=2603277 RepID=UPI0011C1F95A|nr:AraC family transcriptional regulator [Rhizobium sp. WL3]QEE43209.1 helix-turn-helix transcriptional regulator [Rhizobium sp. WL3]